MTTDRVDPTDDSVDESVLRLLATAGEPVDEGELVDAVTELSGRRVDVEQLDGCFVGGVVQRGPDLRIVADGAALADVLRCCGPGGIIRAHRAWSAVLPHGTVRGDRHAVLARVGSARSTAQDAVSVARRSCAAGRHEAAVELFGHAARSSRSAPERAETLVEAAACAYSSGQVDTAEALLTEVRALEPSTSVRRIARVLRGSFGGTGTVAHLQVSDHVDVAADLTTRFGQPAAAFAVLVASPSAVWCPPEADRMRLGEPARSLPDLEAVADRMAAAGETGSALAAYAVLGETAACLGHVAVAVRALDAVRRLGRRLPDSRWLVRADLFDALLSVRFARSSGADATYVVQRAMLSPSPAERTKGELLHAFALIADERWQDGFDLLAAVLSPGDDAEDDRAELTELVAWGALSHLADAARHVGAHATASSIVARLAGRTDVFAGDLARAELLYATAVLSEPDSAASDYRTLLAHSLEGRPWLGARTHLAYGAWLRRHRLVSQARPHLLSATRLFAAMNAASWERRADGELRAAGVRTAGGAKAPVLATLSPQELQIARMAADGLSNREIGQALYLSPRTVGSHLYRIFPKLDVTSRSQLAGALAGVV